MLATACPKPRPRKLEQEDKAAKLKTLDKRETDKAIARAKKRCEMREELNPGSICFARCFRRDYHTHHLIYGIGRRNRGKSVLALYKLRLCQKCHSDIHNKVLKPTTSEHDALTVRYRRKR